MADTDNGRIFWPYKGSKAMRFPPSPARCAYIWVEQSEEDTHGVLIGSHAVIRVPVPICKLSSANVTVAMMDENLESTH